MKSATFSSQKFKAFLFMGLVVTTPSFAIVEAEYLIASEGKELSNHTFGLHFDPLPIPFSLGASVSKGFDKDEASTKIGVTEAIDLESRFWVPLFSIGIVPYIRLGYTLAGKGYSHLEPASATAVSTIDPLESKKLTGYRGGIGISASPLPHVSLILEGGMRNYTLYFEDKLAESEQNTNSSEISQIELRISEIRTGISVGI